MVFSLVQQAFVLGPKEAQRFASKETLIFGSRLLTRLVIAV
jgi:hypothetical protein